MFHRAAVLALVAACASAPPPAPPLHNVASATDAERGPMRARCPESTPAHVKLPQPKLGGLAGIVIDELCGEVAGATIVVHSDLRITSTAITDESGRFAMVDLPPARYTVSVYYLDSTLERGGIQIRAGAVEHIQIAMPPPAKGSPRITLDPLPSP